MFTVDGVAWSVPCDIERQSDVKASDISGMMMNGVQFYDILGTYLNYQVTLAPDPHNMGAYHQLYEILTEPVPSHTFVLPYNSVMVEVEAKVEPPRDVYIDMGPTLPPYWKGCRFTLTALAPYKEETLAGAIARGLPPLPPINEAQIGDAYQWTANGWVETTSLPNAELMAFPRGS